MPNKNEFGQQFGSVGQANMPASRYTFTNPKKRDDPMNQEDKLKDEAEFWLAYINDWENHHDGPVPERALRLLDDALLRLKDYYVENKQAIFLQDSNQSIH